MFWPVNLAMAQSVLRYATAQLVCKLDDPNTYVFFAVPGVPAEFAFQENKQDTIDARGVHVDRQSGIVYVEVTVPGTEPAIRLRTRNGSSTDIIVLSRDQAASL